MCRYADVLVCLQTFEMPDNMTWVYLITNALVGTVLSEILWLWATLVSVCVCM